MVTFRDISTSQPRLRLDRTFYDKVRAGRSHYKLVDKFIIPPNNGRGFIVSRGQTFRIIQAEGPQVGDVTFWNAHNPKEFFSTPRTWMMKGWFLNMYSRLWSDVPWLRPMATCTEDTVVTKPPGSDYHHHLAATHCAPEVYELRSGRIGLNACHLNFLQAIEPFGLTENDIHDNIDVFQKMRLDPKDGKRYGARSDSKVGDYIEFYAEIDLLVAVSVCPCGDGAISGSMPEKVALRPLEIEVYNTGIQPKEFPRWTDWRPTWQGKWMPPQN